MPATHLKFSNILVGTERTQGYPHCVNVTASQLIVQGSVYDYIVVGSGTVLTVACNPGVAVPPFFPRQGIFRMAPAI